MNARRLSGRPALRWLLAILAGGLVAAIPASASEAADNSLVASTPANGGSVDQSPSTVSLQFANQLGTTNSVTMTCGPEGGDATPVPLGSPVLLSDRVTLSVSVPSTLGKGVCNVAWQITDTNLQPAGSGSISFTITADPVVTTSTTTPTTGDTTAGGTGTDTGTDTTTVTTVAPSTGGGTGSGGTAAGSEDTTSTSSQGPLALFRLLSNLGVAVLLGSLVVIAVAWPEGVEYLLTVRFLRISWLLTLVATGLFAGALTAQITGKGLGSSLPPTAWGDLLDTTAGKAALVRFLLVIVCAYVVLQPERAIDPANQLPALGAPALAVATLAFSRDQFGMLEIGVGLIHALAMAVWLGGLCLLVMVVLSGPGEEDLLHAVRGFARLSTPALLLTVLSGVILMFRLDRGSIFSTNHGLVLIVKALFVAAMVFIGLEARRFINQRASRAHTMTLQLANRLRRVLRFETVLGVVVLLLTAWLLTLSPAGLAASSRSAYDLGPVHRFSNTALNAEIDVAFTEEVGLNDVLIEVNQPAEGLSGLAVDFIAPPGSSIGGLTIHTIPLTGTGAVVLPKSAGFSLDVPGTWTIIVRIGTQEVARENVFVSGDGVTAGSTG